MSWVANLKSKRSDPDGTGPLTARIDFSAVALADLDEDSLNETVGIGNGTDNTRFFCPTGAVGIGSGTGAIDWNCDGDGGTDTDVDVVHFATQDSGLSAGIAEACITALLTDGTRIIGCDSVLVRR